MPFLFYSFMKSRNPCDEYPISGSTEPEEQDHYAKNDKRQIRLDSARLDAAGKQSEESCHVRQRVHEPIHDPIVKTADADVEEEEGQAGDSKAKDHVADDCPNRRLRWQQTDADEPSDVDRKRTGHY